MRVKTHSINMQVHATQRGGERKKEKERTKKEKTLQSGSEVKLLRRRGELTGVSLVCVCVCVSVAVEAFTACKTNAPGGRADPHNCAEQAKALTGCTLKLYVYHESLAVFVYPRVSCLWSRACSHSMLRWVVVWSFVACACRLKELNGSAQCSAEFNAYAACMDYNRYAYMHTNVSDEEPRVWRRVCGPWRPR